MVNFICLWSIRSIKIQWCTLLALISLKWIYPTLKYVNFTAYLAFSTTLLNCCSCKHCNNFPFHSWWENLLIIVLKWYLCASCRIPLSWIFHRFVRFSLNDIFRESSSFTSNNWNCFIAICIMKQSSFIVTQHLSAFETLSDYNCRQRRTAIKCCATGREQNRNFHWP